MYTVYSTWHDYMLLFPTRKMTSFRDYTKPWGSVGLIECFGWTGAFFVA
jgi:hypothetical protein